MNPWRVTVMLMVCVLTRTAGAEVAWDYPESPREPVTETIHGHTVVDPYRYLEGDAEGKTTERVAAWTAKQNQLTREVLDALPGRADLEARITELLSVGYVTAPQMGGNRYFYFQRIGTQAQAMVMMREGAWGKPRAVIDPNHLDPDGLTTVSWIEPSHDGSLLAFGMYKAGDENTTLYLLDVDAGKWLSDQIPNKVSGVSWLPDGRRFIYHTLRDVSDPYSRQIKLHTVGVHHRQDPVLFEQYSEGPYTKTWGPSASLSWDGRWLLLSYYTSTSSNDLWVVDFDRYLRTGEFIKQEIVKGETCRTYGMISGDTLFLNTELDAPNGRVLAVDLHRPDREHWTEVIAERSYALEDVSLARGELIANYLVNACTRLERFDLRGNPIGTVSLPKVASASVTVSPDRTEMFLTYSNFVTPRTIYYQDLSDVRLKIWDQSQVKVDPSVLDVKQVWYTSADGTEVPMFLVYRKGIKLDGKNPTLLTGYGGFGNSQTPRFRSTYYPWFEAGGVLAMPNLRGGGEFGAAWHDAGKLENKQNTFDDFIAAAEWLIDQGYTSPEHLGIAGGSNGGLLTGAVTVQRPELFSAVISAVPLLDMARYQDFLMARFWVPEYGSVENADQADFVLAYSPYHNIQENVQYPAMFITAGENDTRVHPMHARKFAAWMQSVAQQTGNANPALLWVDQEAGHGGGRPIEAIVRDIADARIFMMWQLGMLEED